MVEGIGTAEDEPTLVHVPGLLLLKFMPELGLGDWKSAQFRASSPTVPLDGLFIVAMSV